MPIQNAMDGVLNGDAALYRSAFLPDYDAAVAAEEAMWKYEYSTEYSDFNGYLKSVLAAALETDQINYGKHVGMEFIVKEVNEINTTDYPSYFENYNDYYVYYYILNVAAVEKAVKVSGTLNIWGDDGEDSSVAEYVLIRVGGEWYLHPIYYYTSFG